MCYLPITSICFLLKVHLIANVYQAVMLAELFVFIEYAFAEKAPGQFTEHDLQTYSVVFH